LQIFKASKLKSTPIRIFLINVGCDLVVKMATKTVGDDDVIRGFSKFCRQTSLHGWKFIESEKKGLRRFPWILILVSPL
jgi:hypothetical protein